MTKNKVATYIFLSIFLTCLFLLLFSSSFLDNGFKYFSYVYAKINRNIFNIFNISFNNVFYYESFFIVEFTDILLLENIKDLLPNILLLFTSFFFLLFNVSYLQKSKGKKALIILNILIIVLSITIIILSLLNMTNLLYCLIINISKINIFDQNSSFFIEVLESFYYLKNILYYFNETLIKIIMYLIISLFLICVYILTSKLNFKKHLKVLLSLLTTIIGIVFFIENISLSIKPVYFLLDCISHSSHLITYFRYTFKLPTFCCNILYMIINLSRDILSYRFVTDPVRSLTSFLVFTHSHFTITDKILASLNLLYYLFVDMVKVTICIGIAVLNLILSIYYLIHAKRFQKLFSIIGFLNIFIMIIYAIIRSVLATATLFTFIFFST